MAKGPVKRGRKPAPRLQIRTTEDENPAVKASIDARAKLDTLDVSRPYGTVTGKMTVTDAAGELRAVAFEQRGPRGQQSRIYDHLKVRILRPGEQPVVPKGSVQAKADAAAPDLDEDEEETPPMILPVDDEADEVGEADDADVNLTAWAERKVNYRWAQIRDAIETRYGRTVNEPDEARDFLAEQGIGRVSARNASPELRADE